MAELESQPKSVQSIYSWFSEGKLFVNRRYQRKLVWTQVEKQRLIESILCRYPVPAVLLAERDTGDYELIDGLQRLHTLVSFIECSFPTLDGTYFDVSQFPTARSRADEGKFEPVKDGRLLSARDISVFLDYSLAVSVMRGASEIEIDDVFSRINTYGHRLSDQESRQSGVQDDFSNLVRELACEIRGDASSDILTLSQMPSISIDLPMSQHGYDVVADEVFWVRQGILRSTDLRDSMDEQCLADIAACIIGGKVVDRSREALDQLYDAGSEENSRLIDALDVYGADKFKYEVKFCIDELLQVCGANGSQKLRNILYERRNTNPFPSVFAILMIALHEVLVREENKIADYSGVKSALTNLSSRLDTSRKSTTPEERRKNINIVKGLVGPFVVEDKKRQYRINNSTTDIDAIIRRSEIELPHYELKQGMLSLDGSRQANPKSIEKIVKTICAIANNGPEIHGCVIVGVTDSEDDAARIHGMDGVEALKIGRRLVVGVKREADILNEKVEQYFSRWKNAIRNSELSQPLRDDVLSHIDYHEYYGLGVIVIPVTPQRELSFYGDDVYYREGDETKKAQDQRAATRLSRRFY